MPLRPGSAGDPLWYKEAIVYELHVRAFKDSNGDGIGDFPGLVQKLDYLQNLGVTCLWLLPFFPSPLKDDGYDVSDYKDVHPMYGTMEDFRTFLDEAHQRNLQVIVELVVNHTSDQHPWFQAARQAPPGSPERNFYVWSDSDEKYKEARIIFTDTERSNWTWDPVAKAYFWHRFFSHQPDLNFDNPQVVEEVLNVMRYWLDLGVDGLRVDAIPYLVEREGTSCENLPETHVVIKKLRQAIDNEYSNRMILAEANQWPVDVRPYFGDGDEFHMAFHFPLMPRIYMALRQEDRLPITDIMAQTPEIPENCQWALFLRNHDELTLEMVTNEERDYMYLAYSGDPRMRINLGIRRRLAPLVDNNRRRIELLNSLLFSFPGTPIVYYGDEIGMGDNIYLGDRNGVRTPMQWNADRNAGFSTATPARLYSPVIMDPVWGYEAINVEAQQDDLSSLMNWMRNMIALRKLFRVFGRGSLEFLNPQNRKILAYIRRYDSEMILCVANLSRFAQPVDLDLSNFQGMVPVEMIGYVEFPPIDHQPYRLTLGPYGFMWFELQMKVDQSSNSDFDDPVPIFINDGWKSVFEEPERSHLESTEFPDYLRKQRWFGGKSRTIVSSRVADWGPMEPSGMVLALIEVGFHSGAPQNYFLPLAISYGNAAIELRKAAPYAVVMPIVSDSDSGVLHDALFDDGACAALLSLIEGSKEIETLHGRVRGVPSSLLQNLRGTDVSALTIRRISAEQSNSAVIFGDRFILKLFRRNEPGLNPDCEIGRFITERTNFDHIAPYAGQIEYVPEKSTDSTTLGILQGFVTNEGDAWKWTLEEMDRYYENSALISDPQKAAFKYASPVSLSEEPISALARERVGLYLDAAATLGRRTAELHIALASVADDPNFAPEPLSAADVKTLLADIRSHASRVFDILKDRVSQLGDDVLELAAAVLSRRSKILDYFSQLESKTIASQRIRIHGDYHLGQVLRVKTDFVIIDFEGEPTRSLDERRAKQSPIKDVAGMLRSFSYAAYSGLLNYSARHPESIAKLEPWERLWEQSVSAEFLRGYRQAAQQSELIPSSSEEFESFLSIFLLDKALYEVRYELDNRPTWLRIPLMGILSLNL